MKKKALFLLVVFLLAFGCIQKKPENKLNDYELELNSYSFDFEKKIVELNIVSQKELKKARIEVFNEKELKCVNYFDLRKGLNEISFPCIITGMNFLLKIMPSDGKTKEFEIKINPLKKIEFKKGQEYYFLYEKIDSNFSVDYNFFVLDKNENFIEGVIAVSFPKERIFGKILIKNSKVIKLNYSESCKNALEKGLKEKNFFDLTERDIVLPLFFLYYEGGQFNFDEFIETKEFMVPNKEIKFEFDKKIFFEGREAYKINLLVEKKLREIYYVQAENPHILLSFNEKLGNLNFVSERQRKFSCE